MLDRILPALPDGLRLVEPFAGSAAVSLNAGFASALVADFNADLINLYGSIKRDTDLFIAEAGALFDRSRNNRDSFDALRAEFNASDNVFTRPSHDHLCRILTAIQQNFPDQFSRLQDGIRQAYACADFEAARLEAQQIEVDGLDGIRGRITGDVIILLARWMFIEQDITYWTHSGRAKLVGKLSDEGLI